MYSNFIKSLKDYKKISEIKQERELWLKRESTLRWKIPYQTIQKYKANYIDFSKDSVIIGKENELNNIEKETVKD